MLSAICFNLDQSKISSSSDGLRHCSSMKCASVENTVRKGEIACNKQFLLFSQCFLPNMALAFHFQSTLKCRCNLFEFGPV